ncbi:MAG: hypothetical protein RLY86_2016 [Pseudomonadota bacterium]|jgi:hypothetical protein
MTDAPDTRPETRPGTHPGTQPGTQGDPAPAPGLLERLDDRIAAINPDVWLAGALFAVIAPWLNHLT